MDERTKYFATRLLKEMPFHIARANNLPLDFDLPPEWKKSLEEGEKLLTKLTEEGRYFYDKGGSIYNDYKVLRDKNVPEGGMRKIVKKFNLEMSKEEMLSTAEKFIAEWQSVGGKERKK